VATPKGGETLEDSKIRGLGFAISYGMKEEGFKEEEKFPKRLRGCLIGRVIRSVIKG
jgi:hypothetical protein